MPAGELHVSVTCESPATGTATTGAPGSANGVAVTITEAAPLPDEFVALTRNEYAVPFARPVMVADAPDTVVAVVQLRPPSVDCSTT